jgi:hypothetical protein
MQWAMYSTTGLSSSTGFCVSFMAFSTPPIYAARGRGASFFFAASQDFRC